LAILLLSSPLFNISIDNNAIYFQLKKIAHLFLLAYNFIE